jgi:broad specificity phosphatase PhoE
MKNYEIINFVKNRYNKTMKWPKTLTLIRHDTSAYNILKAKKAEDSVYKQFKLAYSKDPQSEETKKLAIGIQDKYALESGDHNTPLATDAGWQAEAVGKRLKDAITLPDVIFVSPYLRTHLTLENIIKGWPELKKVKIIEEERIREQDHGLAILYNDRRVFNVFHPEQESLRKIQTPYWYRFPQGENIPDVRERLRSWLGTLTRDYRDKNVLAITHHLSILGLRANLERLDSEEFIRLDHEEKPINCGVTIYRGSPEEGKNGKLVLEKYNLNLYDN